MEENCSADQNSQRVVAAAIVVVPGEKESYTNKVI